MNEINNQPADQHVRDLIDTSLDQNVVIVAGAGAGKTTAIVSRMIAYVRSGLAETKSIAAITFTRKAAGELRNRFITALHEARDASESDPVVFARINKAILESDQTFAGTIHAFCGQLLRERSFAVGLQPDFVEIDEREEALLRQHVWNEYLHMKQQAGDEGLEQVKTLRVGIDRLYQFFSEANEFRDMQLKPAEPSVPDLELTVSIVQKFVEQLEAISNTDPSIERDPLMRALIQARHFLLNRQLSSPADQAEFIKIFDGIKYGKIVPANWSDPAVAESLKKSEYKQFRDSVVRPALAAWGEYVYATILPFISSAIDYYAEYRRREGLVSFDDLLFYATKLLRESSEARQYFGSKYRHLFVDEFQDTDPVQAELVFLLTASDPDIRDWRAAAPRPGSLCIVGDEKQAIYRFRRADVETFRFAIKRVEETGGLVLELTTSFRSLGNLCGWYNDVFKNILSHEEDRYQARFLPLQKFRPDGADPFCVRKISLPKVYRNNANQIAEEEARKLAAFIRAAVEGTSAVNGADEESLLPPKASPGDFMVLTRKNANLSIYGRELQRHGIPYDIVGGAPIGSSVEMQDLVHVLRAIYEPENPLWILSYLRGNLNGFSDPELYSLVREGGRIRLFSSVPDSLDAHLRDRFVRAFERLRSYRAVLRSQSPLAAIEKIVDDLGLVAFSGSLENGSGRAGTLLRILDLVRQWEAQGLSWGEILQEMMQLIEDPRSNLFESTLEAGRQDVVRLMNVHQSKGLQARVVILADSYNAISTTPGKHVSRMTDPPYVSIKVTVPRQNYPLVIAQPPGWDDDQAEEERFGQAEEDRLRYVAATRARNLLVVCWYEHNMDRGQWQPFYRGLRQVPELEFESRPLTESVVKDLETLDEIVHHRDSALAAAGQPSYTLKTVTDEDEEPATVNVPSGFGTNYGTAVHHLLEMEILDKLPDVPDHYVANFLNDYPDLKGRDRKLLKAVDRFRVSEIYEELQRAEQIFVEAPVGVYEEEASLLMRGKIDLVYKINGDWKIVDYKSVVPSSSDEFATIVTRYEDQLLAYVDFWQRATGESVSQCGIWLTETGDYLPVDLPLLEENR